MSVVQAALAEVAAHRPLDVERAEAVMDAIMEGQATDAQIGGLLVALHMRGETPAELAGFARSMRNHVTRVPTARTPLVDTCGTGGGGVPTLNVSTAAAILGAAAGLGVAKHGNRGVTSPCGSAEVVAALGIDLEQSAERVGQCIDAVGIGFLFAPMLHPAMRHAIGPRREIGLRSAFNLLGPLTNPAGATRQIIGVPAEPLTDLVIEVLAELGAEHAMVVHGRAGVDEVSLEGPTVVREWADGQLRRFVITPGDLGVTEAPLSQVAAAESPAANAAALVAVFEGQPGPARDFVVLNAAAALVVGGAAEDLRAGVQQAYHLLDTGAAAAKLAEWQAWAAAAGS